MGLMGQNKGGDIIRIGLIDVDGRNWKGRGRMGRLTENGYIYQWQIDGKRRPFPSLEKAVKAYGSQNVFFNKPQYVENGICPWCGKVVTNKRRTYCNDKCSRHFNNLTVWHRGRDAYSLRILYRDNFTCQDCGEFHAYKNEHGIYIPIDDGNLEVHHIIPVSMGGDDYQGNLITLCKTCHKIRHDTMRRAEASQTVQTGLFDRSEDGAGLCNLTDSKKDE